MCPTFLAKTLQDTSYRVLGSFLLCVEPRKKQLLTFHYYTGCLLGILSSWFMNNPHITGQYNPLYTLNNQGLFHSSYKDKPFFQGVGAMDVQRIAVCYTRTIPQVDFS